MQLRPSILGVRSVVWHFNRKSDSYPLAFINLYCFAILEYLTKNKEGQGGDVSVVKQVKTIIQVKQLFSHFGLVEVSGLLVMIRHLQFSLSRRSSYRRCMTRNLCIGWSTLLWFVSCTWEISSDYIPWTHGEFRNLIANYQTQKD